MLPIYARMYARMYMYMHACIECMHLAVAELAMGGHMSHHRSQFGRLDLAIAASGERVRLERKHIPARLDQYTMQHAVGCTVLRRVLELAPMQRMRDDRELICRAAGARVALLTR